MTHTPTPWTAINNGTYWCVNVPWGPGESVNKYSPSVAFVWNVEDSTQEANARLIVRAVNAFEPMREALRMALLSINSFWPATPPENETQASEDRAIAATREKLIAALALADKDSDQ